MRKLKLFFACLLMAVLSIGQMWATDVSYTLTISGSDFNTTSYAANNNEKTGNAVCTTDNTKTYEVKWTSNQVMKSGNNMQWQKSKGYIYNSTNLGTIQSVTVNSSAGSFTTYYGTSAQPSSGTTVGGGFFKTSVGGATGTTSSVVVTFVIEESGSDQPTPSDDPSLEASVTSLDFGTVDQNASVTAKTFTLTGSNLTDANTISITAPSGYEVSPTSVTPSDGSVSQTVTVTPVTSAAGTFNGDITIASDDLENNITVGLSMTVEAPFVGKKLTFDLSANPGGWPEANSTTTTNYTYTLNSTAYTFALNNVKCNSGYLMLYYVAKLGLPAIDGYKLVKIEASNSGGCSTSTKVAVTSDEAGQHEVSGGAQQTWATQGSTYTYNLSGTAANTMYYLYVTNKNCQITSLTLYYTEVEKVSSAVTLATNPASVGTVTATVGGVAIGETVQEGKTVVIASTPTDATAYRLSGFTVKDGSNNDVTVNEEAGVYSFVMPASAATVTANYVPLYAVNLAIAVKDQNNQAVQGNAGNAATINGGTTTIYVSEADEIALVATPYTHYDFVGWTTNNDDHIVIAAENTASTTASVDAAVTITANFKEQACSALAAPTLSGVTKDYKSATIAWNAVDNADGYVLNITKHEDGSAVLTNELIVAPEVSFEKTDLEANTQYDYTVMAIGDGLTYCDANNPVLNSNFTTSDYPAATLSLVENGGAAYAWGGENLKMNDVIALPSALAGLGCSDGKVLAGWDANKNCATAPAYAKGENYTLVEGAQTLYAVFATEQAQAGTEYSVFATTSLGSTNTVTTGFAVSAQAESKSGYYQDGSGTTRYVQVKVSNAETQIIPEAPTAITVKAKIGGGTTKDPLTNNVYAVLIDADQNAIGDPVLLTTKVTAATGSDFEASMPIANYANVRGARITHEKESGYNVRYYAISLSYSTGGGVSYSGYTTECDAQLPVLAAPTFPVAEGVFYESTDITISAADGASIYYTTDGTTPSSTNGTLYEGAITLNAYGTYNFKAIAIQAGHEDSEVAEATYYFGMTFASVSDLYTYLSDNSLTSLNNVKVTGLVSRITTAWDAQKGYLTYYISDNGQTTNDLQMYRGVGTGADVLAVGDQVTVTGNYTLFQSTTHEFGAGNTIVARTAAAVASVAIGGAAEKTTYSPEDNVFSRAGITATATYNTGYEKDVTALATWTNNLTNDIVTASGNVEVTATYEGESDMKEVAVTYTSKTLDQITLSYTSTTTYVGMALPTPTVTASYVEDIAAEDVTELVVAANGFDTESKYDNTKAGTYTITVSYTLGEKTKSATYTVTVKAVYNSESDPHTVAAALDIIGALFTTTTASSDSIVVAGKVSRLDGTYVNTYWISDDGTTNNELEVYSGKYLNKVTFTTQNQLHVGDEVVVKGKVKTYNSTKEFDSNSRLISVVREPEFAIADIVAGDEFEANVSEDMAVVPTSNEGNAEFTLTSGDEAVVTIVEGKLHAVAEGDAVITASRAATNNANALNYKEKSITFNVHVIAERTRYTVTFDANGGTGTDPVIANQLEGDPVELPANPYSKENSAFAGWLCDVDGQTYEEGAEYTMTAANVKFTAQWNVVATCAISFQIGGQEVATANAPQTAEYTFTQVGAAVPGFTFLGWSETEVSGEVEELPTIITSYTPEAGESSLTLYGIYSRVQDDGNQHYVLDYSVETALSASTDWGSYGTAYNYTATDGSEWIVKAYKNAGMQINNSKNASIKIPSCPGNIVSIKVTGSAKAVGLSASDYTGSGTPTYIVYGTDATTQTLDLSEKTVTTGYIVPKGGSNAITKIDVEYSTAATYYTSSPVEKVTVTFALAGGKGGCQTTKINKGSEFTICAEVPTKTHSEFTGWKNGETIYEAGQAYTFDADITLTAQWNDAATYTVTYNVNGSEDAAPTQEAQYAGDQFAVADGVTKDGYTFKGWLYNNKLYKAGAQFTMPAANVEFVANWKKNNIATEKMLLISDANGLSNGMAIALGCSYGEGNFAMAGDIPSGKAYLDYVSGENITLNNGLATFTGDVITMIAEQVEGGWKLRKDETHYLTLTGTDVKWDTQANATAWTISFSNGNVQIASGNNKMQFNSNSPRFKTYTSNQTAIQLFGTATVVTNDAKISDLGYEEEGLNIVASGDITLTIDEPTNAQSITATNGATVVVEETTTATSIKVDDKSKINITAQTTVNEVFSVAATMGGGKSGQVSGVDKVALAQSVEAYFDITLGANGTSAQWHAIAVPFPVDAINGIYDAATGEKLTNEVNYAIMAYDGAIRATGAYGWKKYRQILQPGVFYLMTVDGDTKTFRFKMSGITLPTATSLALSLYAASGDGQGTDAGWNGVANPTLKHGTVNQTVTVLNPETYTYEDHDAGSYNFVVGTPFFIQADATIVAEGMEMGAVDGEKPYYAPRRAANNIVENIKVFFGNEEYKDKLTISANEEALNEYQIGKDLVKMTMTNTPKVAQIFGNAYNAKLCRVYAPMSNDKAEYSLTLYAPEAGEYTISVPEMENAEIYLTKDGAIIWNLTMSEYTNDFAKGNNEGYGLLLIKKITGISTGVENIEAAEAGVQKVVIDDKVFILRGEKMYDVNGKLVK